MFDLRCMMIPLFSFQFKCCYIQMLTKCFLVQVCYTASVIELNICQVSSRALFGSNFCVVVVVFYGCFANTFVHLAGSLHQCAASNHLYGLPIRFTMFMHAKKRVMPFEGQPRKWKLVRRFPRLEVRLSSIPNAGFGLFVAEDVKAGQPIATYRRRIVSEAMAKKLKKEVSNVHDQNVVS